MRFLLLFAILLASCTDANKSDINDLLDARDASISQQNIQQYATLLSDNYIQDVGAEKISAMKDIFSRFEKVIMTSRDRELRIGENNTAICEQTYILKVFADGEWREIVQREQLSFELINNQWKISGGL